MKELTPFKDMFDNQAALVDNYIRAGKQKSYPMPIDSKDTQEFIRTLMGFLIEEVYEAYQLIEQKNIELHNVAPKDLKAVEEYLIDFNEELGDTLAFWVEIFMYINISEKDLNEYYQVLLEKMDLASLINKGDTLAMAIDFANIIIQLGQRTTVRAIQTNSHSLLSYHKDNIQLPDYFLSGGNHISMNIIKLSEHYIFEMVKNLQYARNLMKNKFWKDSQSGVDFDLFSHYIIEAWLNYMVFLICNGLQTSTQIAHIFLHKNQINLNRIENKW